MDMRSIALKVLPSLIVRKGRLLGRGVKRSGIRTTILIGIIKTRIFGVIWISPMWSILLPRKLYPRCLILEYKVGVLLSVEFVRSVMHDGNFFCFHCSHVVCESVYPS